MVSGVHPVAPVPECEILGKHRRGMHLLILLTPYFRFINFFSLQIGPLCIHLTKRREVQIPPGFTVSRFLISEKLVHTHHEVVHPVPEKRIASDCRFDDLMHKGIILLPEGTDGITGTTSNR